MIKILLLVSIALMPLKPFGQTLIDVAESTLKVSGMGEEVFYLGFAEGDQLIFSFEELNGRELKEIEIIELPGSSKFMDYKTVKISNKVLNISRTSIYKFRFSNSTLRGRICRWKVQRVPGNASTLNFNTNVYWRTVTDTTYTPVQERYVVRIDTIVTQLTDQIAKISSQSALNGNPNKAIIDVELPFGTTSWSYYIGVGTEGKQAYETAKGNFVKATVTGISKLSAYEPTTLLALTGINLIDKTQGRNNVKYWFITDWDNVRLFQGGHSFLQYKQGDVVNEASQMRSPLAGKIYLALLNDNVMEPIEVLVRITAIQIRNSWGTRMVNRMNVTQRRVPYLNN